MKTREVLNRIVPRSVKRVLRKLQSLDYCEDSLETDRITDFLFSNHFGTAYEAGKATGSWGCSELRWRVFVACWAAQHAKHLAGDFVECGVNRGGMARAVVEYVDFVGSDKMFYLLDTYCGIPKRMKPASASQPFDYSECYDEVKQTFAHFPNVQIIRGTVPDSLGEVKAERIAFLSIDMNCAEPEIAAAEFFWDRITDGGIVVLDDYCYSEHYRLQNEAFDVFARARNTQVLALPTGQGLLFKSHSS